MFGQCIRLVLARGGFGTKNCGIQLLESNSFPPWWEMESRGARLLSPGAGQVSLHLHLLIAQHQAQLPPNQHQCSSLE